MWKTNTLESMLCSPVKCSSPNIGAPYAQPSKDVSNTAKRGVHLPPCSSIMHMHTSLSPEVTQVSLPPPAYHYASSSLHQTEDPGWRPSPNSMIFSPVISTSQPLPLTFIERQSCCPVYSTATPSYSSQSVTPPVQHFQDENHRIASNERYSLPNVHTGQNPGTLLSQTQTDLDLIQKQLRAVVKLRKQCPICGKVCSRPSTLRTHYLIHTGDTPFKCTWEHCNKSFNVKSNMLRHLRTHQKKVAKKKHQ
ncbi:hypothetical protein SKDZ_16G2790 [Saccharomyces kudriavzevii ZP591]|uniref:YPR015C-like protein n=1 Tax=Saccharomyces cerevisiae x Saccharomyces kudriavzevii (strain VIN7) TaxID=1095631 RepID=H0H2A7_SACCK|nr:YPR015C-like protein [Saccharomyces cerevisiae x Saccharomyces kudriavzevii VIN7]CAI4053683.1 hypothetical protein SKDZ_16G2790 [Saccharomyces kudriavzevii ZP591]